MDEFIGFDIDNKHTLACVVQAGHPERHVLGMPEHPRLDLYQPLRDAVRG